MCLEKRGWNWKDSYCSDSSICQRPCPPCGHLWGRLLCPFWEMVQSQLPSVCKQAARALLFAAVSLSCHRRPARSSLVASAPFGQQPPRCEEGLGVRSQATTASHSQEDHH